MNILKEKEHEIFTDKVSKDSNIALFADIHYSNIFDEKLFDKIIESLSKRDINYICVAGDNIDMVNILDDREKYIKFLRFFKNISKIAPTMVSLGSHDFSRMINGKWIMDYNRAWFRELNNINNLHFLHNNIYEGKEIRFIGYTQSYKYYYNDSKKGSKEDMILSLNKNFMDNSITSDKLNVLLCHSPILALDDDIFNEVEFWKNIDIILSGHMHAGCMPEIFDKILTYISHLIKNDNSKLKQFLINGGFIYPNKKLFPMVARGRITKKIDNHETNLIITSGITTIQESAPKILQPLDNFFNPNIDYIKVKTLKK